MSDQVRDGAKGLVLSLLFIAVAAIVTGVGIGIDVATKKVERIHSPSGLIVITPEGKKVFIPDSALLPEGSRK